MKPDKNPTQVFMLKRVVVKDGKDSKPNRTSLVTPTQVVKKRKDKNRQPSKAAQQNRQSARRQHSEMNLVKGLNQVY